MGQAKIKAEAARRRFLQDIDDSLAPVTERERELLADVMQMKFRTIPRADPSVIAYCRMLPQECHQNALDYCALDPTKSSKIVSGWWRRHDDRCGSAFQFHSVVLAQGQLICITPYSDEVDLEFAVDDRVVWQKNTEGLWKAALNGQSIPQSLREDPAAHGRMMEVVRERLTSGMNPWEALRV